MTTHRKRFAVTMGMMMAAGVAAWPVVAIGASKPKPPPCPGGRYLVEGLPLSGELERTDAIVLAADTLSTESGCAPVTAKIRARKKVTKVSARWPTCTGLTGPVQFRGRIDAATCGKLTGSFKAKKAKVRRRITAQIQGPPAFTVGPFAPAPLAPSSVGPEGGTVAVTDPASPVAGVTLVVPPGATEEPITFAVEWAELSGASGLPVGAAAASKMIRITASGSEQWNLYRAFTRPVRVTLPYTAPAEGEEAVRFYVLNGDGTLEPAGLEAQDLGAHTVSFFTSTFADSAEPSRVGEAALRATAAETTFNSYVAVVPNLQLVAALLGVVRQNLTVNSGFNPKANGWYIPNFGSYYKASRGGSCWGFVASAKHYYRKRFAPRLYDNYRDADRTPTWVDDKVAIEYAARVHNGLSDIWNDVRTNELDFQTPSSRAVALSIVGALDVTGMPVLLYINQSVAGVLSGAHAIMVYRADINEGGFTLHVYDPNHPNLDDRRITFTHGVGFASYLSGTTAAASNFTYNWFKHLGYHLGLSDALLDRIKSAADRGFTGSTVFPTVTITSITGANDGQPATEGTSLTGEHKYVIADNAARIQGTILGGFAQNACCVVNQAQVYVSNQHSVAAVNNAVGAGDGRFDVVVPVAQGENDFVVIGATQTFSHWAAFRRDVIESTASLAALTATLSWTRDDADIDLYVKEPDAPGKTGDTVYFGHRRGVSFVNPYLDLDNTGGYGPEHYVAETGTRTLYIDGTEAPNLYGDYTVRAHYYADHDSTPEVTQPIPWRLQWRFLAFCPDPCTDPEADGFWEEGSASGTLTAASSGNCCDIDNQGADWSSPATISYPPPDPLDYVIPDPPGVMLP